MEETTRTTMEDKKRLDGSDRMKRGTRKGTIPCLLLPVWTVEKCGNDLRVDSNNVLRLWTVGGKRRKVRNSQTEETARKKGPNTSD